MTFPGRPSVQAGERCYLPVPVRRRLLAGWDDLAVREVEIGVQAGDPIFLAPDHRVDPVLALYSQGYSIVYEACGLALFPDTSLLLYARPL